MPPFVVFRRLDEPEPSFDHRALALGHRRKSGNVELAVGEAAGASVHNLVGWRAIRGGTNGMFLRESERQWQESGYEGIELCMLHVNGEGGGAVLIRARAGARFPAHDHPGGEDAILLEGRVRLGSRQLAPGDYLWSGPGDVHDLEAIEDSLLFANSPLGIKIVGDQIPAV
jgi:quercetin dioxygenase-like cupin family protein